MDSRILHTSTGAPYIPLTTTTGSFYLTRLYPQDAHDMARIMALPEIYTRLQNPPYPYQLAHAQSWINAQTDMTDNSPKELPFAAIRADDPQSGSYIGSCSLRPQLNSPVSSAQATSVDHEDERVYVLGYYLDPEYYGRGIMPVAVKALVSYAFSIGRPRTTAILVQISDDNSASESVIRKVGSFCLTGEEELVAWPEYRGGGRKRLISWKCERDVYCALP